MKKTLVALSVLSAVSTVNAAEVYKNDSVSVSIAGTAEVQLLKGWESKNESTFETEIPQDIDSCLKLESGDLTVATSVRVSESLRAVGGLGFDLTGSEAKADKSYVGLTNEDWGTVTFGRQSLISDDDGIGKDYGLGYAQYGNEKQIEKENEVVKYVYDDGKYYFGVSHALKGEKGEGSSVTDGRIGVRVNDIDARFYVYTDDKNEEHSQNATTAYNLEVEYDFDEALSLAASYGAADVDAVAERVDVSSTRHAEVASSYAVSDDTALSLGYVYTTERVTPIPNTTEKGKKREHQSIYANVTKQLQDNVKVYAEVGYVDQESEKSHTSTDLAYLAGMKVTF